MRSLSTTGCSVSEQTLGRSFQAVSIENDLLAATVLVDKGADIYELVYKPRNMDVMWKSPWGIKEWGQGVPSAFNSVSTWLESYPGGWQVLFPNGGDPCMYKGVELNFHGEASTSAWNYEITETGGSVGEVCLSARLRRSPFTIERTMRVEAGRPILILQECITNQGGEAIDYMWGHHPAYGAPFLSQACRVDIGARSLRADDNYLGFANPLRPGECYTWPIVEQEGTETDMSRVPGPDTPRAILGYFEDFEDGWYAITNTELGLGVGLVWPVEVFPYAWYWQEMHASSGYPWYKDIYTMAIEPFSSIPGQGLVAVMDKTGTHRTLAPGESAEVQLLVIFYESTTGVQRIEGDGTPIFREE